jgi:hypothetical protein
LTAGSIATIGTLNRSRKISIEAALAVLHAVMTSLTP